jgi:hypothetical protein
MDDSAVNLQNTNKLRFDDLVRSELYFTATLLPLLLFHENRKGVRGIQRFAELIDKNAKTEHGPNGELIREKGSTNCNDFKDFEVITEFHIAI